jgi:hypothetical protein
LENKDLSLLRIEYLLQNSKIPLSIDKSCQTLQMRIARSLPENPNISLETGNHVDAWEKRGKKVFHHTLPNQTILKNREGLTLLAHA